MKPARPRVIANFAITADGKVSTRNYTPTGFTSPADKARLRAIRALGDAVMVGAGTLAHDAMSLGLSSRALQRERTARGMAAEPLRVIVSNRGRIDPAGKAFQTAGAPIVIFSTRQMPAKTQSALAAKCDLWLFEQPQTDLAQMLDILHREYRVRTLICEGGPTLFRSLLEIGAIDELRLTWAPVVFVGAKAPTLTGLPGAFLAKTARARLVEMEPVGRECFLTYRFPRGQKRDQKAET